MPARRGKGALTRAPRGSIEVAAEIDELYRSLIEEHGFLERRSPREKGKVQDGVYITRSAKGFIVWVPPEPERSMGRPAVLPPAVEVIAEPDARGTRLEIRRAVAPAMKRELGLLLAVTLGLALVLDASQRKFLVPPHRGGCQVAA